MKEANYIPDLRYYVRSANGSYIVQAGNGLPWWGCRTRAIAFEKREAEIRAKIGHDGTGLHPGSVEEAPAMLRVDFPFCEA